MNKRLDSRGHVLADVAIDGLMDRLAGQAGSLWLDRDRHVTLPDALAEYGAIRRSLQVRWFYPRGLTKTITRRISTAGGRGKTQMLSWNISVT